MTAENHPAWCERQHGPGEPHGSEEFDVEALDGSFFVRLAEDQEDEDGECEPVIILESNPGTEPFRTTFSLKGAHDFTDVLGELRCIARKCHCVGDKFCPSTYDSYAEYKELFK